jgi:glutamine synthetase
MKYSQRASSDELQAFLKKHADLNIVETLLPDINGILRGKRICRDELESLFDGGLKTCASTVFLNSRGETSLDIGIGTLDGDPDVLVYPVANTLKPVPWHDMPVAQIFTSLYEFDGNPYFLDSRHVLQRICQKLADQGLYATVATEFEFYLLEQGNGNIPTPRLFRVPGTNIKQSGLQYASMDELLECDQLIMDILHNCKSQDIPANTAFSEFAPGQYEINLHHVNDPITACDQGAMLKRIIKATAHKHGLGASFMAKPFIDYAGCGLHIHISIFDDNGDNVFSDSKSDEIPAISTTMKHAVGGLQDTMADAMAIFAPNANSYRRLKPFSFVPLSPSWGYNHRSVALRIPVSDNKNMRIEHRVAGADANPYLVMAAVLAGIHYGIINKSEPSKMITEKTKIKNQEISLPIRWEASLDRFKNSKILPDYLGKEFCQVFELTRRNECDQFHEQISNIDYEWYLRSV